VSDPSGPPTLSLALRSVVGATMDAGTRTALLSVVRPREPQGRPRLPHDGTSVIPLPAPRNPLDDGPDAA
jgi:hypothetical protein